MDDFAVFGRALNPTAVRALFAGTSPLELEMNGSPVATIPSISHQPQSQGVVAGQAADFSVLATGTPLPQFQWQKDNVNLSGEVGATLSFSNVQTTDAGSYRVVVSSSAGSVNSDPAVLTVTALPTLTDPKQPADNNPADNRFTITEMTAYASAWKQGKLWPIDPSPIPVAYLTRAGSIWKGGEVYYYNAAAGAAPLCWIAGPRPTVTSLGRQTLTLLKANSGFSAGGMGISGAVRQVSAAYQPGVKLPVKLSATPASGTFAYALEEHFPGGWTAAEITQGGTIDVASGAIKWGPFFDNQPRMLQYSLMPPATSTGVGRFSGGGSFDGIEYLRIHSPQERVNQ